MRLWLQQWVIAAVVSSVLLSCYALKPSASGVSSRARSDTAATSNVVVSTADSTAQRPRLLPLRSYVDELAKRQTALEQRVDSIAKDIAAIKSSLRRDTAASAPPQDSVVAGVGSNTQLRGTRLPQLQPQVGVIYPDSVLDTASVRSATRRATSRRRPSPAVVKKTRRREAPPLLPTESRSAASPAPLLPESQRRLLDSAIGAIRATRYDQAISALDRLIAAQPPQVGEYLYWRALARYMKGETAQAFTDAEQAYAKLRTTRSPRLPDLMYLLAELYSSRAEHAKAKELLRVILERYPSSDAAILARKKLQQLATLQ